MASVCVVVSKKQVTVIAARLSSGIAEMQISFSDPLVDDVIASPPCTPLRHCENFRNASTIAKRPATCSFENAFYGVFCFSIANQIT